MSANFGEFYEELVTQIYMDDMDAQQYYLSMVEDQRNISVDYLLKRKCLFIPNNEYIHHYMGKKADAYGLEMYREDRCLWTLFILTPIQDLSGDVVGVVGWDALHKYQEVSEGLTGLTMYQVSSKNVFKRERYFLSDVELLRESFPQRTILITDGVYDSISLNYHGFPAIALLGSTVSREVLYFLRWYKKVYVCADNDAAGQQLYSRLRKALPCVVKVIQDKTKDIEEYLRSDDGSPGSVTAQLRKAMQEGLHGDVYLR